VVVHVVVVLPPRATDTLQCLHVARDESATLTLKCSHTALRTDVFAIASCTRVCYNVDVRVSLYKPLTLSRNALIGKAVVIAALKCKLLLP